MAIQIISLVIGTTLTVLLTIFSYKQKWINENQIRLGLFDKRFNFYSELRETIRCIDRDKELSDECNDKLHYLKRISIFLFDQGFQKQLDNIIDLSKNLSLENINFSVTKANKIDNLNSNEFTEAQKKFYDAIDAIHDVNINLENMFYPYIDFSIYKIG